MIKSVGEILKKFRTEGACIRFSPQTIGYMANKLGYKKRREGRKIGYEHNLITDICRHIREAMEYENALHDKTPQKRQKQPNLGDYYTYNGERDNADYEWEKNENKNIKQLIKLTEQDLHKIVKEATTKIIKEMVGL